MAAFNLIVALYAITAAAAPLRPRSPAFSGLGSGSGSGLGGGGSGFSLPSGIPGLSGGGGSEEGTEDSPTSSGGFGDFLSGLLDGLGGGSGGDLGGGLTGSSGDLGGGIPAGGGGLGGLGGGLGGGSGSAGSTDGTTVSGECAPVTVVFARGTGDPGGALGTIVGPGFASDLEAAYGEGNVAVVGVEYSASAAGIAQEVGSGGEGSTAMAEAVNNVLASCPDTKLALSGYSQGAMVAHNALGQLDGASAAKVQAVVTFGDPFGSRAPTELAEGGFKTFCGQGDPVCGAVAAQSDSAASGHLGYGSDTQAAAAFVQSVIPV